MSDTIFFLYFAVVFLIPWLYYMYQVLRLTIHLRKEGYSSFNTFSKRKVLLERLQYENHVIAEEYRNVKRWFKRVIMIWLIGFFALIQIMILLVSLGVI